MTNEKLSLTLDQMINKSMKSLNKELSEADHPITKLTIVSRYEGYGIALKELGADTSKLGMLVETQATEIEPQLRKYFQ